MSLAADALASVNKRTRPEACQSVSSAARDGFLRVQRRSRKGLLYHCSQDHRAASASRRCEAGYSLKHYRDFFTSDNWQQALWNSVAIAPVATLLSVSFGTLAAIGLSSEHVPFRRAIMAILISPMIVPLIISAAGMYFFYSRLGLQGTYWGVVLAHAALGIPFVIITVTATLVGFDRSLTRAAANMGADPVTTFFRVQMPLILPGVISGGLFAFITSFDEVVVVLFVGSAGQKTLPWQMFTGLREQISPTILAVATILVSISIVLLTTVELLRRRSERMRGLSPG